MREQKIIEDIQIDGISADGRSVGRKDGQVIFIKGGAPGDVVDIKVVGKDKKFLVGEIVNFHQKSSDRVDPFCEHFGTCGGCKWQHINYDAQLKFKQSHVAENMKKMVDADLPDMRPIIGSEATSFYRNKLEYTFSNKKWLTYDEIKSGVQVNREALGFHIPKMFDKILDIKQCHLQSDPSNDIRLALKEYASSNELTFYDLRTHEGFLRNLIIRIASTGEVMVIVQFAKDEPKNIEGTMNFLKERFPEISSLNYIINEKKNDSFYDLPVINFSGQDCIYEQMGDLKFRIGPKSFYQTNSIQAHELYNQVLDFAGLGGDELVYDLYTGTGTIANFIAHKAKKVVGIESVAEAVEDAKINSQINGIENTSFFAGDMKDMLSEQFLGKNGRPNVIITDPPRAGMHKNVVSALNKILAEKIVYVSCNPATQARDLNDLKDNYNITILQPVDMFPQTQHVENVILLELKK